MAITTSQLPAYLAKGLAPLYVLYGAAPLLVIEAADAIRAAARAAGYTERTLLAFEARSDWSELAAQANAQSLFGDLRVLDIRIPSGKPGKQGGEALAKFAAHLPSDTVSIITLPELDYTQMKSSWFNSLLAAGLMVEGRGIERAQLPRWLQQRAQSMGLKLADDAANWIADKTEGNLLAANQELQKLSLLCTDGADRVVSLAAAQDAVLDVARYHIDQLSQALLAGDAARAMRVLDGLRAEDEALPLILFKLGDVLRLANRGGTRARLGTAQVAELGSVLALTERQFKGVAAGAPWQSLNRVVTLLAA